MKRRSECAALHVLHHGYLCNFQKAVQLPVAAIFLGDSDIWSTFRNLQFSVLTVLNFYLDFQPLGK
jgi:hypothetical protein